jgi:hypothetical protein
MPQDQLIVQNTLRSLSGNVLIGIWRNVDLPMMKVHGLLAQVPEDEVGDAPTCLCAFVRRVRVSALVLELTSKITLILTCVDAAYREKYGHDWQHHASDKRSKR